MIKPRGSFFKSVNCPEEAKKLRKDSEELKERIWFWMDWIELRSKERLAKQNSEFYSINCVT